MDVAYGIGFLLIFGASALIGVVLRKLLPSEHLSDENMAAIRLVTGLLVTFVALILSLQLSSARQVFDLANRDRSFYAAQLSNLDQCLRNMGKTMLPARLRLRQYTAAVIASTWPWEATPSVEGMPDVSRMNLRGEDPVLATLMNEIGLAVDAVATSDPQGANLAARCRAAFGGVVQARWAVIEDERAPSGNVFLVIVSLWLSLVFLSFGLQIPRRLLAGLLLTTGTIAMASIMFVIVDLATPYTGLFGIPSSAMRDALRDMSR